MTTFSYSQDRGRRFMPPGDRIVVWRQNIPRQYSSCLADSEQMRIAFVIYAMCVGVSRPGARFAPIHPSGQSAEGMSGAHAAVLTCQQRREQFSRAATCRSNSGFSLSGVLSRRNTARVHLVSPARLVSKGRKPAGNCSRKLGAA